MYHERMVLISPVQGYRPRRDPPGMLEHGHPQPRAFHSSSPHSIRHRHRNRIIA
jgi:hypothetical protein